MYLYSWAGSAICFWVIIIMDVILWYILLWKQLIQCADVGCGIVHVACYWLLKPTCSSFSIFGGFQLSQFLYPTVSHVKVLHYHSCAVSAPLYTSLLSLMLKIFSGTLHAGLMVSVLNKLFFVLWSHLLSYYGI
jgi:hypothetical protein